MHTETATPCPTPTQDPQPDLPGRTMPARIAALLHTVRILLGFGRHLAETASSARPPRTSMPSRPASAPGGCRRSSHICNAASCGPWRWNGCCSHGRPGAGISASAHQASVRPHYRPRRTGSRTGQQAEHAPGQSAEAQVAPKPVARPSRPAGWNNPELYMPTLEQLEAQARRRPPGRTLVAICLDLAVVPGSAPARSGTNCSTASACMAAASAP